MNARVELAGVDGAALHYRGLTMPAGRTSMQMTLASQGRSASALTGALSGSGTVTLEAARIAGLDPRAFDVAIRASDSGQATDDARLRQIVEPVLSAGALPVDFGANPVHVSATAGFASARPRSMPTAPAPSYPADTTFPPTRPISAPRSPRPRPGRTSSRPEIQLFAAGSPDALDRNVDVASLSSWLAVRAIDRETSRLDSIERGERRHRLTCRRQFRRPPQRRRHAGPATREPAASDARPRRPPPKPKSSAPRPPAACAAKPPQSRAPVVSQQAAPLPPPIEVRPPPGPRSGAAAEAETAAGADAAGRDPPPRTGF